MNPRARSNSARGVAACVLAACMAGCMAEAGVEDAVGSDPVAITVPAAALTKQAVGAIMEQDRSRSFSYMCTGALVKLDVNKFKDDRFDKKADDDGTIPHWVLTAAHCVDAAKTYAIRLPNVCVDDAGKAAACANAQQKRMMIRFAGNDCFKTDHTNAAKMSDTALCFISDKICSPDKLKSIAWTLPSLAADRYKGGHDVVVHGQRHSFNFVPQWKTYPGWGTDPQYKESNPSDFSGSIWPGEGRPAKHMGGTLINVSKDFKLKALGGGKKDIDWAVSEGTVDQGDSGGPVYRGDAIVATNHANLRQGNVSDPGKGADCHAERETPANAALAAECARIPRIVHSISSAVWEPMAKDVVAGTWTGLAVVDMPADAADHNLHEESRQLAIAHEPAGDLNAEIINESCVDDSGDEDDDGYPVPGDNCPTVTNPDQLDADRDGVGDACDTCPALYDPWQTDSDWDGVGDECDVCPGDFDPGQVDRDLDQIGDACDPPDDTDEDGVIDDLDNCVTVHNPGQENEDGDGIGDACECIRTPIPGRPDPG